jgi:dipeptidase
MEIISKGSYELGAVWVAVKIPDGYISGHANQLRITTFPLNDPENCLYSPDVITFARKIKLFDGRDEDFSFVDTYRPLDFDVATTCESRVWFFFQAVLGEEWGNQYLDFATGANITNRLPLWVKPERKVNVTDLMEYMRSHFEGTPLDMAGVQFSDVGAGPFNLPYRTGSLDWSIDGGKTNYFNQRPIAVPQTGLHMVILSRSHVPREFAALNWFGVDDSSTSVRFPIYGSATRVPTSFAGNYQLGKCANL